MTPDGDIEALNISMGNVADNLQNNWHVSVKEERPMNRQSNMDTNRQVSVRQNRDASAVHMPSSSGKCLSAGADCAVDCQFDIKGPRI